MKDNDLVWYVCYGSNIFKERFLCYIHGGQPAGSQRHYDGCRNTSFPKDEKPTIIKHELYFAKESSAWENGGVGFVNIEADKKVKTLARMYLIKKQQLEDIAKQETNSDDYFDINFEEAIAKGNTIFKKGSWYGNLIFIGNDNGHPIFTLTNENNLTNTTRPSEAYVRTIIQGIQQTQKLTRQEIANYFLSKRGVNGNYTTDELKNLMEKAEKKLIPFNYDRIYACKQGALRVLILIFYLMELLPIFIFVARCIDYYNDKYHSSYGYLVFFPFGNYKVEYEEGILLFYTNFMIYSVILYYSYWTLIRISLWIIDGFKEK